jgi:hypothetical protein
MMNGRSSQIWGDCGECMHRRTRHSKCRANQTKCFQHWFPGLWFSYQSECSSPLALEGLRRAQPGTFSAGLWRRAIRHPCRVNGHQHTPLHSLAQPSHCLKAAAGCNGIRRVQSPNAAPAWIRVCSIERNVSFVLVNQTKSGAIDSAFTSCAISSLEGRPVRRFAASIIFGSRVMSLAVLRKIPGRPST